MVSAYEANASFTSEGDTLGVREQDILRFTVPRVWGVSSPPPRGLEECLLMRKEVDEKNTQPERLEQQHVSEAFITAGLTGAWLQPDSWNYPQSPWFSTHPPQLSPRLVSAFPTC